MINNDSKQQLTKTVLQNVNRNGWQYLQQRTVDQRFNFSLTGKTVHLKQMPALYHLLLLHHNSHHSHQCQGWHMTTTPAIIDYYYYYNEGEGTRLYYVPPTTMATTTSTLRSTYAQNNGLGLPQEQICTQNKWELIPLCKSFSCNFVTMYDRNKIQKQIYPQMLSKMVILV